MKNIQVAVVCNEITQPSKAVLRAALAQVIPWLGRNWNLAAEPAEDGLLFLIMDDTPEGHALWRQYRVRFPIENIVLCGSSGLPGSARWLFDWKSGGKPPALRLFNLLAHWAESQAKPPLSGEIFDPDDYIQGIIDESLRDGISRICALADGPEFCLLAGEKTCYAPNGLERLIPLFLANRENILVTKVSDAELLRKLNFARFSSRLSKYAALGDGLDLLEQAGAQNIKSYSADEISWLATLVNSQGRRLADCPFDELSQIPCWPDWAGSPFYQDYLPFRAAMRGAAPKLRDMAALMSATGRQIVDVHNACALLGLVERHEPELSLGDGLALSAGDAPMLSEPVELPVAEASELSESPAFDQTTNLKPGRLMAVESRVFERDEFDQLEPMDSALFERMKAELLGLSGPGPGPAPASPAPAPTAEPGPDLSGMDQYQLAQDHLYRALKPIATNMSGQLKIIICGPDGAGKTTAINTLKDCAQVAAGNRLIDGNPQAISGQSFKLDYAEICYQDLPLHVYGTPGNRNFDVLGDVLCKSAWGLVLLINHADINPIGELAHYLKCYESNLPKLRVAIGVTHHGDVADVELGEYRSYLDKRGMPYGVNMVNPRDPMDLARMMEAMAAGVNNTPAAPKNPASFSNERSASFGFTDSLARRNMVLA